MTCPLGSALKTAYLYANIIMNKENKSKIHPLVIKDRYAVLKLLLTVLLGVTIFLMDYIIEWRTIRC